MATDNNQFLFGQVAFFGRGIEEYVDMFALNLEAISGMSVLDCPAGPAAFAKQCADRGIKVTACDPMYENSDVQALRQVVDNHAQDVAKKQALNRALFHPELSPATVRREAMEIFLNDFSAGKASGRYLAGRLPHLPFEDSSFDMVLSANLLFIYSDIESGGMLENSPFDFAFHQAAIYELMRVSRSEVRIYPLRGPGQPEVQHSYLQPLMENLANSAYSVQIVPVGQRDIIGAEQMLLISH